MRLWGTDQIDIQKYTAVNEMIEHKGALRNFQRSAVLAEVSSHFSTDLKSGGLIAIDFPQIIEPGWLKKFFCLFATNWDCSEWCQLVMNETIVGTSNFNDISYADSVSPTATGVVSLIPNWWRGFLLRAGNSANETFLMASRLFQWLDPESPFW
jgi:hypothetical protein